MSDSASLSPAAAFAGDDDAAPIAPRTIEETGMSREFLIELALKVMYRRGVETVSAISEITRISPGILSDIFGILRDDRLIATLGSLRADVRAEMRFELTEIGRLRAMEAVGRVDYAGPCPVTLEQFRAQVAAQSVKDHRISRADMEAAFAKLITPEGVLDRLGPAVNSGRSILLYGPPGNGKSSYAHALAKAMEGGIHVPYAIMVDGEIIQLFDPALHRMIPEDDPWTPRDLLEEGAPDLRFAHCVRPAVVTGAELTTDMLDLRFNPTSRTYQAPVHMKAANGVLIIDDLGRQRQTPQTLINRLIVPMEEAVDYLSLQSGMSFQVPFDTLMILSTNIPPNDLLDGAGLRRIYYKIMIARPSQEDFVKIFLRVCEARSVAAPPEAVRYILDVLYPQSGLDFAAYHAVYVVDQCIASCDFHGLPRQLRPDFMGDAWGNLSIIADA
ncbi:ATPase family associated with various cellular activities (AAA) [Albimonas donghaensis]|uniref:ATPase family associated with various cellular activities (AAA) n=1 Tax=Albimonas donghaensis TaxID=356660 RepID=A0A1H2WJ70_9RHOB|nr:AAA family ATPase [Albimonas donghaensis]SDW80605.1 ATPase family associated with various cellular activities (AAA) [Albimonas donghaensis]